MSLEEKDYQSIADKLTAEFNRPYTSEDVITIGKKIVRNYNEMSRLLRKNETLKFENLSRVELEGLASLDIAWSE